MDDRSLIDSYSLLVGGVFGFFAGCMVTSIYFTEKIKELRDAQRSRDDKRRSKAEEARKFHGYPFGSDDEDDEDEDEEDDM